MQMFQHRQALKTGDLCTVSDEHILFSEPDANDEQLSAGNALNVRTMEAMSGYLTAPLAVPMEKSSRNVRFVHSRQLMISYDYVIGRYTVVNRADNRVLAAINKRPPPHAYIACSCASQLSDGMFFFSYATGTGTDDAKDNHWSVHAVLASNETATISLAFLTDFKGSGFADKPQGRIVSLHCHPSKQYLFVVYSKGTVQVNFCLQRQFSIKYKVSDVYLTLNIALRRCGPMPNATSTSCSNSSEGSAPAVAASGTPPGVQVQGGWTPGTQQKRTRRRRATTMPVRPAPCRCPLLLEALAQAREAQAPLGRLLASPPARAAYSPD